MLTDGRLHVFGTGPQFHADSGRYSPPLPETSLADWGADDGAEDSLPLETCDDVFASLMIMYAYGELDYEYVIQFAVDDAAEEFILEHMAFVMEEVNSGRVHPNDAGTLLGQVSWVDRCNLEPFVE